MNNKYQSPRNMRAHDVTTGGRCRAGYLYPIAATPFLQGEGGVLKQNITQELDQIAGRMITEVTAEVYTVFVPLAGIIDVDPNHASDPYAGSPEMMRGLLENSSTAMLQAGTGEHEISKAAGVKPRSISGSKLVNEAIHFGHNVAVNFLRRRKHVNASQVTYTDKNITPALLSSTILDRLNLVLDPEDRVNGAVNFTGSLPVKTRYALEAGVDFKDAEANDTLTAGSKYSLAANGSEYTDEGDVYDISTAYAELQGADGISLDEFYKAQKMDQLTRAMRKIVDANPVDGEEQVTRWAHGLSVETGKNPYLLYHKEITFGTAMQRATDGASMDQVRSNLFAQFQYAVPVPANEFGGIAFTFISVKPDETIANQPTPILSEDWGGINFVADEMAIDPVAVTVRDVNSDCSSGDENTIIGYNGNNHLRKSYISYGLARNISASDIDEEMVLWQYDIPLSVTPESVIYDQTTIDDDTGSDAFQAPFLDVTADVCKYTVRTNAMIATPLIFGPTPVEELAQIETDDIFEDA